MKCPLTARDWQEYTETGDVRIKQHLAGCAACRVRASEYDSLHAVLAAMPVVKSPAVAAPQSAPVGEINCAEFRTMLEAWREGELDATKTFLMDDHLLWCDPCAIEVERAERLGVLLHELPEVYVPAAVAERIRAAQVPWWERLLPPAHAWQRLGWATAAIALVLASTILPRTSQLVNLAKGPQNKPTISTVKPPETKPSVPNVVVPIETNQAVVTPVEEPIAEVQPVVAHSKKRIPAVRPATIETPAPTYVPPKTEYVAPVPVPTPTVEPAPPEVDTSNFDVAKNDIEHIIAESHYGTSEEDASNVPENITMLPGTRPNG